MALGIEDLAVGHWTDPVGLTGCTVVVPPPGNVAAASVRGGGPGTRETDLLQPQAHVQGVSAVLLTGGSAFGLAAAQGVVAWCEQRGLGYGRFAEPLSLVLPDFTLDEDQRAPGLITARIGTHRNPDCQHRRSRNPPEPGRVLNPAEVARQNDADEREKCRDHEKEVRVMNPVQLG